MLKRSRTNTSTGRVRQIAAKPKLMDGAISRPKAGNAQQIFDKYISLARECMTTGDRVMAESYYQHAEHYLRLINEQRVVVARIQPVDTEATEDDTNLLEFGGHESDLVTEFQPLQ